MFAALLCLSVLVVLTSACLARPLRSPVTSQSCRSGRQPMPDLNALILRSSPRVLGSEQDLLTMTRLVRTDRQPSPCGSGVDPQCEAR
jgi:hypothetical protein